MARNGKLRTFAMLLVGLLTLGKASKSFWSGAATP